MGKMTGRDDTGDKKRISREARSQYSTRRIDWPAIEAKWRNEWDQSRQFEADPDQRPKKFITVAYPYPNSPQHVGHGRTYTLADIHARFYRMKGYNVLFPMAFHYTGTPILGMARRVEEGDADLIDNLKNLYGVPEDAISGFAEPVRIADYFHEEIRTGMIEMGYSIDWRREFTTIDPVYSRFIQWQISTLRDKNLVIQGSHPVGWCPRDQNPVSQHDTLGDVEPDFTEYALIKFRLGEYVIPTATLRPETIFGAVNLWVNPGITYKKITVDGEKWIVSQECAYKLEFQDKTVSYDGEISGSELAGRSASMPHRDESVVMLPAGFVQSGTGTGMVMSVPAHAPIDYQALEDLKESEEWGAAASGITPKSIIEVDGYGEMPGVEVTRRMGITDQNDPRIEEATKEVYAAEFYGGRLRQNAGEFSGLPVEHAKDPVRDWLREKGYADMMLELTNTPVRCRCGAECVVKVLNNQWFLNYADAQWKESTTRCFESMSILPQEIRPEFNYVIGWLRERACARQHGMGTKLPWDKDWIVESLSDSVIYMAYYVIAKFVNDGAVSAEALTGGEFFDYIFLGRGQADAVSEATGIPEDTVRKIRDEFMYFYPVDSRHSGRDLVPNHLTFFVMNHIAIFPEKHWPRQIVVNGSVLMNGSKMSKSMGNIIPLRKAIQEYGADPIRLAIVISAELLQDADFNMEAVSGIQGRLEAFHHECAVLKAVEIGGTEAEDRWILSRLQSMINHATESIEKMRVREALHGVLFGFESEMGWYARRTAAKNRRNEGVLYRIHSVRVAMLSPFAPHVAEEMWGMLGHAGLASRSRWPEFMPGEVDPVAVQSEDLLRSTMEDIAKILKVTKITPKRVTVYTAGPLKSRAYRAVLGMILGGQTGMGPIMKSLVADSETSGIKRNPDFVQKAIKDILSDPVQIRNARMESGEFDEKAFLSEELAGLAGLELGTKIRVFCETDAGIDDAKGKARHSRPFKPAILIE